MLCYFCSVKTVCFLLHLDGKDYNNTPLIATFNAGDTTATVVLPIVNDNIKEEEEELNLTIAISPLTGVKLGTLINANVVIIDTSKDNIITYVCTCQHLLCCIM